MKGQSCYFRKGHEHGGDAPKSAEKRPREWLWQIKNQARGIKTVLDLLPCAVALWTPDRQACVINHWAIKLAGFSETDFRSAPSLWAERVHPLDRGVVSTAWEKLRQGEKIVFSDYRFYPEGNRREIWLRDVSVAYHNTKREIEGIASAYTDISDLKLNSPGSDKKEQAMNILGIMDGAIHEIQNNLQGISMEYDLSRLSRPSDFQDGPILNSIERLKRTVTELQEYLFLPDTKLALASPEVFLEELIAHLEKELRRRGIRLCVTHGSPLPSLRVDSAQFRKALERIIEFASVLLPQGGDLGIEGGVLEIDQHRYLELKVANRSVIPFDLGEENVFQPFLRINNCEVGLSMALAQEILRRHEGQVFFEKIDAHRSCFTILVKVCSD